MTPSHDDDGMRRTGDEGQSVKLVASCDTDEEPWIWHIDPFILIFPFHGIRWGSSFFWLLACPLYFWPTRYKTTSTGISVELIHIIINNDLRSPSPHFKWKEPLAPRVSCDFILFSGWVWTRCSLEMKGLDNTSNDEDEDDEDQIRLLIY